MVDIEIKVFWNIYLDNAHLDLNAKRTGWTISNKMDLMTLTS
jgi:hypothetical protein